MGFDGFSRNFCPIVFLWVDQIGTDDLPGYLVDDLHLDLIDEHDYFLVTKRGTNSKMMSYSCSPQSYFSKFIDVIKAHPVVG